MAQLAAQPGAHASAQDMEAVVSTEAAEDHQSVPVSVPQAASLQLHLGPVSLSDSDFTVYGRTQFIRTLTLSHGDSATPQPIKKKRSLSFVSAKRILSVVVTRTL